jgi:Bacterial archaeo-eukaryotic release factor family 3
MTTSTLTATSGILDNHAVKFLAGCDRPCITIVVPAHHPGAQDGSRKALVHRLVRTAGEQLTRGKLAGRAAELLAPLEEIAQETGVEAGGAGFAIFRSPEHTARYYLPDKWGGEPAEKVVIADHFYLAPFVAGAFAPHEFFVLGLSTKHLRLFHYFNGECRELPLPAAVPASLDAAGGFDQPDHQLENRSASGPSTGAMRGVHVGTLSDREAFPEYLHHFFGVVDRGLKPTLNGKPLLLMGVREEVAAYRRAAKHAHILTPDCLGSIDVLNTQDVAARAAQAGREHYQLLAERALAEYLEMTDRARTLAHVPAVLRAASEGRVHRLCVRAGAELAGSGGEDLVNASIVETLRAGGDVFVLAEEKMPAAHPLAAILRY